MITLILLVCLAGSTDVCKEEAPPTPEGFYCAVQGQFIASEWIEEHPAWVLRGWRCRYGVPERKA